MVVFSKNTEKECFKARYPLKSDNSACVALRGHVSNSWGLVQIASEKNFESKNTAITQQNEASLLCELLWIHLSLTDIFSTTRWNDVTVF